MKTSKLILGLLVTLPLIANAQFTNRWMAVGSLHNWFSEIGNEIEVGRTPSSPQQDGLQWPAIYSYQDNQAAKGFWIGTTNFTDATGTYPKRVVHIGPRVNGQNEFFPVDFKMTSKFDPPVVFVDGVPSFDKQVVNDFVDPDLKADRMIYNKVNSLLGITMERKIMQWSDQFHDNYMIYEYTFVNTGNTDSDAEIEHPETLTDVMFFWQYRYAFTFEIGYLIQNSSRWGINTMNDARGDGAENPELYGDPENERFRAQFAWHGYHSDKNVPYDNIGAPIFYPDAEGYIAKDDTVGRLGAPQFGGIVTMHADASASDHSDDLSQPSTTGWYGSDEPNTSNNDPFNNAKMSSEYDWMTRGNQSPRHARRVVPDGDYAGQSIMANVAPGQPGGFSFGNGYGPYTMGPGDTVKIIMAEAVSGLSRNSCIEIGKQYKRGEISDYEKNTWVMTGKDSLFQTFRRAIANYESGYNLANSPKPTKVFNINGGGDRISLSWDLYDEEGVSGFRIYRSVGRHDKPEELIAELPATARKYDDLSPIRGIAYYYYIQVVGEDQAAVPDLNIPATASLSSRYYTQSYDPTFLKRPPGDSETFATKDSKLRVVPNPYIISSDQNRLRFGTENADRLAFFNIPGQCTIDIYTERGEKITTIDHSDGSGDEYWNSVTSSNQLVVSGVYIAVVTDKQSGKKEIVKFVVIR
ncbi:MAG: hypothetical protein H6627_03585 [Calditrichae bacterium]|nr:hypothetical protein [Calditrichota bacterium]MCB9057621.1 hypothetical protein [Calditrichia bacterium]